MKKGTYVSLVGLVCGLVLTPLQGIAETTEANSETVVQNEEEQKTETTDETFVTSEQSTDKTTSSVTERVGETASSESDEVSEQTVTTVDEVNQVKESPERERQRSKRLAATAPSVDTWMPDKALQARVADTLQIAVSDLTPEAMANLKTLRLMYQGDEQIASLQGLEYATNLNYFFMKTNQVTDFSVLASLPALEQVYLQGNNVTSANLPAFGANIKVLNLGWSSVDNQVYDKILQMSNLEVLVFEYNMNITTIAPLKNLPNLKQLRVQTCGISDFTVIKEFPALNYLAAYGQNIGRNDEPTTVMADDLGYDKEKKTLFIPFAMLPNRLTNFDGFQPPFVLSNSSSNTQLDFNDTLVDPSRLTITEEGITVSNISQAEFDSINSFSYNARIDNPIGSYQTPENYSFYSITAGTYFHQFKVDHRKVAGDVTVRYLDENGNELHEPATIKGFIGENFDISGNDYQLSIEGYTLDKSKSPKVTGVFKKEPQTLTFYYVKEPDLLGIVTVCYIDQNGNEIHKPVILTQPVGEKFDVSGTKYRLEIAGYTLDKSQLPTNVTGEFTKESQKVVYIYKQNTKASNEQADSKRALRAVEIKRGTKRVKRTRTVVVKRRHYSDPDPKDPPMLPQTSEKSSATWMILGQSLLALVLLGFGYKHIRKKRSND